MLITPAMLRQSSIDAPTHPPTRRFQFGDDVPTQPFIGSSNNNNNNNNNNNVAPAAPPMPPGAQDQDDLVMSMLEGLSDDDGNDEILDDEFNDDLNSPTNQMDGSTTGGLFGKWSGFF